MDETTLLDLKQFITTTVSQQATLLEANLTAKTEQLIRSETEQLKIDTKQLRRDTEELRGETKQIRSDTEQLRGEVEGLRTDIVELRTDVNGLRADMMEAFSGIGEAIDVSNDINGRLIKDHERRLTRLERKAA